MRFHGNHLNSNHLLRIGLTVAAMLAASYAQSGWTTSGVKILNPAGAQYVIAGVNWYGFETKAYVAHGMYAQNYTTILDEVKQDGYNTVRLPFSNQMWETDPKPGANYISACAQCKGLPSRDIMALIVNYAGSIGLHVILDDHRSTAGNSANSDGLWYDTSGGNNYTEQNWLRDWISIEDWVHGIPQTLGATDSITVNLNAADGFPIVMGFDLINEPHTVCSHSGCSYGTGAQWGSGDGISPAVNPNPNPFSPACVASSTCYDWRLAAERAGDDILGEAASHGWSYPLLFVEGVSEYPQPGGTQANGPYDYYWNGGQLLGVNGNSTNSGAPIVFNAGGNASSLGTAVDNQVVYSAHDYGPSVYAQPWFNTSTCYSSGCSSSSLADLWHVHWAYIDLGEINPTWPGHSSFPWGNTGATAYTSAPVWVGEFGTGNNSSDLYTSGAGSEGQWFTDMVNFINSSYGATASNSSGLAVVDLNWTYWALNTEDSFALLGNNYLGFANPNKEYSFLCFNQQAPFAIPQGSGSGQCGSTGAMPAPQ